MIKAVNTFCIAILLLTNIALSSLFARDVQDNTDLPKVLIIGDSISIGYTPHVRELLEGKAQVIHNKGNAGNTGRGLKNIEKYIGKTKWDVIHFNWGLWIYAIATRTLKPRENETRRTAQLHILWRNMRRIWINLSHV